MRETDPAGVGVGHGPRVGWFLPEGERWNPDHFRTYFLFEMDASLRTRRIGAAFLRFFITDIQRERGVSPPSELRVVYAPTKMPANAAWYSSSRPIPSLLDGSGPEWSVRQELNFQEGAPVWVDITPLVQQAQTTGSGSLRFVLAVTLAPESRSGLSLPSPYTGGMGNWSSRAGNSFNNLSMPPSGAGFALYPRQQLTRGPALVLSFDDAAAGPPPFVVACGDQHCYPQEDCPVDCINGEGDHQAPVVEVGLEMTCSMSTTGPYRPPLATSQARALGWKSQGLFDVRSGNLLGRALDIPVPCIRWYRSDAMTSPVVRVPVHDGADSLARTIWYRVQDERRLAKVWLRSNEAPAHPESHAFYTGVVTAYPGRFPLQGSYDVALRCGAPTEVTVRAWDFAAQRNHDPL